MDDHDPPSQPRRGLLSGQYHDAGAGDARSGSTSRDAPRSQPNSGGLLTRFGSPLSGPVKSDPDPSDAADGSAAPQRGWRRLMGGARRQSSDQQPRAARARDWRATDFSTGDLDDWDQYGDAPFDMPPDPDAPSHRDRRDRDDQREKRDRRGGRGGRRSRQERWDSWDDPELDGEWDGAWEAGSWDTAWAADEPLEPSPPRRRRGQGGQDRRRSERAVPDAGGELIGDLRQALDHDALSESLNTMAQLSAVTRPLSRVSRLRLLMRRRPTAAAMLAFFLLGFMLTCCAPLIPLARLGYDTIDLTRHVTHLEQMAAGGTAQLINGSKLSEAQADIAAINGDLYEINGAVAVAGAPLGAVSPTIRNYQLLVRIGYDLTGAANESIQVAQSLLTPLEGGALSANSSAPGITPADIQQARVLLADADARTLDAVGVYHQLDQNALPAQLKPGTKYGDYLALLPLAQKVFGELKNLLDAAPALLGVGQPAYFLAIAMDRTELRAGGGFQGNYGILELDGGKQSKSSPFGLKNTYTLDQLYAQKFGATPSAICSHQVTEPPNSAWWWPVRCVAQYGWGLRDSNVSPDFPTNARAAIQIVQGVGTLNNAPIQGVVAFTPVLIEDILQATGPLPMPEYGVTVTAKNLETEIHTYQLDKPTAAGQDRKQFTHDLASLLLTRIKSLHGSGLKTIFNIAEQAIKSKDLQVYLADPRAELILQQLGLSSSVATGGGDGFFVVDTNDGGNKANLYVTEAQTDLVTLLPNGGAYHRLAISVTYDKNGRSVFNPGSSFYDYSDIQRTYLPGDATLTGWSGYAPDIFSPDDCSGSTLSYATIISDCSQAHGIVGVSTNSDVAGREMVMGPLLVMCGITPQDDWGNFRSQLEQANCTQPQPPHTETIFLSWYTPHAYTVDASGHGHYTELVEKQAGDQPTLAVYVTRGDITGPQQITDLGTFNALTAKAQQAFKGPLTQNQVVSYSW